MDETINAKIMGETGEKAIEDMSLEELEAMEDEEDERVLLQYRYITIQIFNHGIGNSHVIMAFQKSYWSHYPSNRCVHTPHLHFTGKLWYYL